jgi:NADPH-dependent glutamate synthase beta subunit-like oxidoreductase
MAQRTIVQLVDDIDGKPADETVTFSLDGITYEIDLSTQNADKLRASFTPYVEKARKAGTRRAARPVRDTGARTTDNPERSAEIRAWAQQQGITVNDRGRIPAQVLEAHELNKPDRAKSPAPKIPQTTFQAPSSF